MSIRVRILSKAGFVELQNANLIVTRLEILNSRANSINIQKSRVEKLESVTKDILLKSRLRKSKGDNVGDFPQLQPRTYDPDSGPCTTLLRDPVIAKRALCCLPNPMISMSLITVDTRSKPEFLDILLGRWSICGFTIILSSSRASIGYRDRAASIKLWISALR